MFRVADLLECENKLTRTGLVPADSQPIYVLIKCTKDYLGYSLSSISQFASPFNTSHAQVHESNYTTKSKQSILEDSLKVHVCRLGLVSMTDVPPNTVGI